MTRLVAESLGPPRRKFSIHFERGATREGDGWVFNAWTFDENGAEIGWKDFWDPTVTDLLPTILSHSDPDLTWIVEQTGEQVSAYDLRKFDQTSA